MHLRSPNVAEIPQGQKNDAVRLHLTIPLWFWHSLSSICKRRQPTKSTQDLMFTLGFLLAFCGIKSKTRPRAQGHTKGRILFLSFMAVLFLGVTGAVLRSHFSAKLPLKSKGLSWIQGPMQALCTEEHFIPGMI